MSKKKIASTKKTTHTKTTRFKKTQIGSALAKQFGHKPKGKSY